MYRASLFYATVYSRPRGNRSGIIGARRCSCCWRAFSCLRLFDDCPGLLSLLIPLFVIGSGYGQGPSRGSKLSLANIPTILASYAGP